MMNDIPRQRRNLDKLLNLLLKYKRHQVEGEKGFRYINNIPGHTVFTSLYELFDWIRQKHMDDFTENQEQNVEGNLNIAISAFKQAIEFDPHASVKGSEQDILLVGSKFIETAENAYNSMRLYMSELRYILTTEKVLKEAKEYADNAKESAKDAKETEFAKQVLLGEGVGEKLERHFEKESETHLKQSRLWLKSTIWWSILGFLGAIAFAVFYDHSSDNIPAALFPIFQKLLIVSVYFYMLSLLAKNYNASRHNYVVNKHRQLVIDSALALRALSGDKTAVGDMLLSHAVEAACGMQTSGYLSKEDKIGIPISGITKIISDTQTK